MTQPRQRSAGSVGFLASMIAGSLALADGAAAMSHGELAGAIRSANYPCAHVLKVDSAGNDAWVVQCNSGAFNVSRDKDGHFLVTQTGGNAKK